jgi:hypothetical protein
VNHQPTDDERLRLLLEQTVADVEPGDGLETIRSRTKGTDMPTPLSAKRPWIWSALGAAVAAAAVIVGFAVLGDRDQDADAPASIVSPSATPSIQPSDPLAVGIYYVGDTPAGPRLYREFHQVPGQSRIQAAVERATMTPTDPDYRTDWPTGSIVGANFDGIGVNGQYTITLSDGSLRERPVGMSKQEAQIAVEALIYTVQASGQTRAPVQFFLGQNPIDQVYGVPTSEPLAEGNPLDVLSLVSITSPEEGATVSRQFEASGVANSFEANVPWQIMQGDRVVKSDATMAAGAYEDKLFPWHVSIDVSDLAPGSYTFMAMTDDPSGGAEGNGPYTDTRTIVIL